VSAFEVSGGLFADAVGGKRYLEMPAMMKVGTDVIIVPHDAVHQLELQAQTEPGGLKAVYSSAADKVTDTYGTVKDKATDTYSNIASSSVDKQRDFVIGKTAGRDVILPADQAATATPAALTTNAVESEQIVKLDAATATELQNATPASATDVNSKGEVVEGEVLVRQGETITEEHADRAISAGILGSLVAAAAQHAASTTYGNVHSSVTGAAGSHSEQASSSLENAALGKPSAREVIASDGSVLVAPGQIITQPIIDRADAHGKKRRGDRCRRSGGRERSRPGHLRHGERRRHQRVGHGERESRGTDRNRSGQKGRLRRRVVGKADQKCRRTPGYSRDSGQR